MATEWMSREQIISAIRGIFPATLDVDVAAECAGDAISNCYDLVGELRVGDASIPLAVSARKRASRRAVMELASALEPSSKESVLRIFVTPYMWPNVGEAARELGIGYLDLAGNAYLHRGPLHIDIRGRGTPPVPDREASLFSPKASRVVRALLYSPQEILPQVAIAERSGISAGYVSRIISELVDAGHAERSGEGIRLLDPEMLLDEWAADYSRRRITWSAWELPPLGAPEAAIADAAAAAGVRLAGTGLRAAAMLAPYGRGGVLQLYGDAGLMALLTRIGAMPAPGAGTLLVNAPPWDEGVFMDTREVDGVWIVHPVQLYLDLWRLGDRGREAAGFLRREYIDF